MPFRRLFLEKLLNAFDAGKLEFFSSLEPLRDQSSFLDYLTPLREAEWVVYAKRPFRWQRKINSGPRRTCSCGQKRTQAERGSDKKK
jgi:hypothetical protein